MSASGSNRKRFSPALASAMLRLGILLPQVALSAAAISPWTALYCSFVNGTCTTDVALGQNRTESVLLGAECTDCECRGLYTCNQAFPEGCSCNSCTSGKTAPWYAFQCTAAAPHEISDMPRVGKTLTCQWVVSENGTWKGPWFTGPDKYACTGCKIETSHYYDSYGYVLPCDSCKTQADSFIV